MTAETITVDGKEYKVFVIYPSRMRRFAIMEGANTGTALSSRKIRDILGTAYSYSMSIKPDPKAPDDYDAFYEAISAPVECHRVIMPFGQETLEFDAAVYSGEDTDMGVAGSTRRWDGLQITFEAMEPQRRPER